MPRVSAAFFATGVICVLTGMLWGMHMGSTNDFTLAPAHAHLNLLGWVTMALYGTFYALTRESMSARLAWINYVFALLGGLILIPALTLFLSSNDSRLIPVMIVGEVFTVIAMLVFAISVFRELFRQRASN
jgi:hypothetical protein